MDERSEARIAAERPQRNEPPVLVVFTVGPSGELRPVRLPGLPSALGENLAAALTPPRLGPGIRRKIEIPRRLAAARRAWHLTPRHVEVLHALVLGNSNREIAERLGCRPKTVEAHVTALLERADAESRLAVVSAFWLDLTLE